MGCGGSGAPDTDTLLENVEGADNIDGCADAEGGDPGGQGGHWKTDVIGQSAEVAEDVPVIEHLAQGVATMLNTLIDIEQGISKAVDGLVNGALSLVGLSWPRLNAVRVGDMMVGLPHMHAPPIGIFPPFGPVFRMTWLPQVGWVLDMGFLSGAATVKVNGRPAARCGDMGVTIPLCFGFVPFFEIFLGSATVWFEGQRAARILDVTNDCMACDPGIGIGKIGACITGSGDVKVGGVPMPSLTDMFLGLVVMVGTHGLGRIAKWVARRNWVRNGARRIANMTGISGPLSRIARMQAALGDRIARWQRWIADHRPPPRTFGGRAPRFQVFGLRPGYMHEQFPFNRQWSPFFPQGVSYLDDAGRDAHRLFVVDGKFHNADGVFSTPNANRLHDKGPGQIFVMDAQGNIYTGDPSTGRFHHSSFTAGEPVAFAGEIRIVDGVPSYVSNASGHYRPPASAYQQLEEALAEMGIDPSTLRFDAVPGS